MSCCGFPTGIWLYSTLWEMGCCTKWPLGSVQQVVMWFFFCKLGISLQQHPPSSVPFPPLVCLNYSSFKTFYVQITLNHLPKNMCLFALKSLCAADISGQILMDLCWSHFSCRLDLGNSLALCCSRLVIDDRKLRKAFPSLVFFIV